MRDEYDFSKARRNPYAKYLNTEITVSVSNEAINFLQQESKETGIPFQTLVNIVLMNYAGEGKAEEPLYKYERNIYWSEQDNAFIAEVPELPGCIADGKTVEEAVKNVEEEITIWMEMAREMGWEIPQPKIRENN